MKQITDERGTVREFYRESSFLAAGLPSLGPWRQVNITGTRQGALRGLHGEEMLKLVAVVEGEAFGAYLDARPGMAGVSVSPLDPTAAIAWPLPADLPET
jgi:dTDP-4-dehydrorhamnose 3,5-epimerase